MIIYKKYGFTFVELIITTTILIILGAIGFASYVGNLPDARDAQRKSGIANIGGALKLYKQNKGIYPLPGVSGEYFGLLNNGQLVAIQGKMSKSVKLPTLDDIPTDPYIKVPYFYSVTTSKQEYNLALTLENVDIPKSYLQGDYKTVAKNVLPSLVLALESTSDVEIHTGVSDGSINRKKFILNDTKYNLPYELDSSFTPYSDSNITSLEFLLQDQSIDFWQNTDYRNCIEIKEAGKSIGNGEYQILDDNGNLVSTGCTSM